MNQTDLQIGENFEFTPAHNGLWYFGSVNEAYQLFAFRFLTLQQVQPNLGTWTATLGHWM